MPKAATVTRIKQASPAEFPVPQNRDQVTSYVAAIGTAQRERDRLELAMNDEIAKLKARYEEEAQPFKTEIEERTKGVQAWCEANRNALTNDGKTKTVQLATGEIQWRMRPPSCAIRKVEDVIARLRQLKLTRFLRTKVEVDKEAILKDPDAVRGVKGVSIEQGEDFVIKPLETQLEQIAK